jgi:hypothetical protein
LAVSVETRKEKHEQYNPLKGSARQYELMYVIADERDVIQLRTNFNREDAFLYRTTATPQAARMLLVDVLGRVNQIAKKPEFYDTADPRVLLPGYSDQLAYDQGLIVRRGTFAETRQQAYVNPLAQRYAGREDFSELIRRR